MNNPAIGDALDIRREFYARIRKAYWAAGQPMYWRMEQIMRELKAEDSTYRALTTSALQQIMTGDRKRLPRWETLSAVISALRVTAEETGIDPEEVGNLSSWRQSLIQAACEAAKRE